VRLLAHLNHAPNWIHAHRGLEDLHEALRLFDLVPRCLCLMRRHVASILADIEGMGAAIPRGQEGGLRLRALGLRARDLALAMASLVRNYPLWNLTNAEVEKVWCSAALFRRAAIRLCADVTDQLVADAFRVVISAVPEEGARLITWIRRKPLAERLALWNILRANVDAAEERGIASRRGELKRMFAAQIDTAIGVLEWVQMGDSGTFSEEPV